MLTDQGVHFAQRRSIAAAEKGSACEAAMTATREIERELRRHIADEFDALAERLRAGIAKAYQNALQQARLALEAAQHSAAIILERETIEAIERQTLPELRRLLTLGSEATPGDALDGEYLQASCA